MKKMAVAVLSACLLVSAGSAAYAAPVAEKKHEQKMHEHKMHEKKMHAKSMHGHKSKLHAKSKSMKAKGLHAKSLRAKDVTELPKTGFGGASEQTE
jgi:opacity protein-like surface antigen